MKKFIGYYLAVIAIALGILPGRASTFYWVAGSGDWNDPDNWSSTPNCTINCLGQVPNVGDDVVIDNSTGFQGGTITINTAAVMRNCTINVTSGTLTGTGSYTMTIFGSAKFDGNMTMSLAGTTYFKSNGTETIDMDGASFTGPVSFDGNGGTWTLQNPFTCNNWVYLIRGTLDLAGETLTCRYFHADGTNTRKLDADGATINLTQAIDVNGLKTFDVDNATGFTLDTDPLTEIHFLFNSAVQGAGGIVSLSGGLDFDGLVHFHNATSQPANIYGNNDFETLILDGSMNFLESNDVDDLEMAGGQIYTITSGEMLNIANSWQVNQGSCAQHTALKATRLDPSTPATIDYSGTCANLDLKFLVIEYVDYTGVNALTSCSSANVDYIWNMTSSSGWPGAPGGYPANLYWVGNNGVWSQCSNWYDPGLGGASSVLPGPTTNVYFDGSSFSGGGQSCTLDIKNAYCADMDWSSVTNSPTFESSSLTNNLSIYGSCTLVAAMNFDYDATTHFMGKLSHTITSATQVFSGLVYFNGQNGTYTLADDFENTNYTYLYAGTWDMNGEDVFLRGLYSNVINNRTLDLGSSRIEVDLIWSVYPFTTYPPQQDVTFTLIEGTSEIKMLTGGFGSAGDYGDTYWDVILNDPTGTQVVQGNNTFNDVTFLGNGTITGANTYNDDLILTPGKTYSISNTQTVNGALNATGSCTQYIGITGGAFSFSGNQTVDYCVITNNTASGTGTFTANNSVLNGTSGWSAGSSSGQNFYFVTQPGGTNEWGDPDNWWDGFGSLANPWNCIPGPEDNVFFSDTSFVNKDSLSIDVLNAYCRSMKWNTTSAENPVVIATNANNKLHIFGNLKFVGVGSMDWQFDGEVHFRGLSSGSPYLVDPADQVFLKELLFDGSGTTWNLAPNCTLQTTTGTYGINLVNGHLDTDGQPIISSHIYGNATASLTITNSIVELTATSFHAWNTSPSFGFTGTNSTIRIRQLSNNGSVWFTSGTATFDNVEFKGSGTSFLVSSTGSLTFTSATFEGNASITCSNTFGTLTFTPNKTYTLTSGTTQTILTSLVASGTQGNPVYIKSSSSANAATIRKDNAPDICLDWLILEDISAVDGTQFPGSDSNPNVQFFAGLNSAPGYGNTGWTFTDCVQLTRSGCLGELVEFNFVNNGSDFTWDFGDGSSTLNTPNAQASHMYTAIGQYQVQVTVDWGTGTVETQYFLVTLDATCCHASQDESYEEKSGTLIFSEVWPHKVYVSDDIFVTSGAFLDITNCDVAFAAGKGIYFEDDTKLYATNSTFRPCAAGTSWTGLDFADESTGKLNENSIIAAETGAAIATDQTVQMSNNQFVNNAKGVYLTMNDETQMEHTITGNTFVLNSDNPFTDKTVPYTSVYFYGIQVSGLRLLGVVSQNDFSYTSSISNVDYVYGIHNNSGEVVASENTFTNITYPYYQNGGVGTNTFENNEVDYNQAVINLYSSATELVGVTISGSPTPTYVSNNVMTLSYQSGENSTGIYNNATGTVSHGNKISGFEYGIKYIQSDGEISRNEIDDAEIGIHLNETSAQVDVVDNTVTGSTVTGISLYRCPEEVLVKRNTVKNDPDVNTAGIEYILTTAVLVNDVYFYDNCVFDTEHAMYFENQHASVNDLPVIEGNYLFTYGTSGIYIDYFNGTIGVAPNPSRNSFVPNVPTGFGAPWDIQEISGLVAVSVYGYWPATINLNNVTDNGTTGGNDNSYATCGNQALKEGDLSPFQAYITGRYPVDYDGREYLLKADHIAAIGNVDQSRRGDHAMAVYGILLSNDNMVQAEGFIGSLEAQNILEGDELRRMQYHHEVQSGNPDAALIHLSGITPRGIDEEELLFTEMVRMRLAANHTDLRSLNTQDSAALVEIDNRRGKYAPAARDMVHVAKSGYPFIYDHELPQRNPGSTGKNNAPAPGALLVYPNPAQGDFTVAFNVENLDNARITVNNMLGVPLMNIPVLPGNARQLQLDATHLPAGIYTVSFYNNGTLMDALQLVRE